MSNMLNASIYYRNCAYFFASICLVLVMIIAGMFIVILRQQDKIAFQDSVIINYPAHPEHRNHRKSWKLEYMINHSWFKHKSRGAFPSSINTPFPIISTVNKN